MKRYIKEKRRVGQEKIRMKNEPEEKFRTADGRNWRKNVLHK